MLEGRQFFPYDPGVSELLQVALTAARNQYAGTRDPRWADTISRLTSTSMDINSAADAQANGTSPPVSARAGSSLWNRLNDALSNLSNFPGVKDAVANLPVDTQAATGPALPVLLGAVVLVGLGYWWTQRKT